MKTIATLYANSRGILAGVIIAGTALAMTGCAGAGAPNYGVSADAITPRIDGNSQVLNDISAVERAHLQLIATNMISTLVQIPSMRSGSITLQINPPQTAYGNAVVRALEDAGFGLQKVSADQGKHFVSYSKRISETESGLVTDYQLSVGQVSLRREYGVRGSLLYPSSLMTIDGTDSISDIELSDDIFFEKQASRESPPLEQFDKYRRTVLIFDDNSTQIMGDANKQAVRLLVRAFSDDDIMMIKACLDADGRNNAAMTRAIRVEQELLSFGIPSESTYIAPCARASYRHSSDDSPTPVELVHYRPK